MNNKTPQQKRDNIRAFFEAVGGEIGGYPELKSADRPLLESIMAVYDIEPEAVTTKEPE